MVKISAFEFLRWESSRLTAHYRFDGNQLMYFFDTLKYPVIFLVGFTTCYLLTPLIRRLAIALKIVDTPGDRRLNSTPVPRGGGVAVFLGFHMACAAIFLLPWPPFAGSLSLSWWLQFLPVSLFLLLVGLIDDVMDIKAVYKLSAQMLVAAAMFYLNVRVGNILGFELPFLADFAITVFWFLLVVNAFNLIDGMDGLASGLACIASVGMAGALLYLRQPGDVLVLVGLLSACLAFLRYNFHPASIFLGDSGSMFIGFTLAAIALSTGSEQTALASIGVPILAIGVPVLDTALAVWRRSVWKLSPLVRNQRRKGGLMQADMEHLHHRLLKTGKTQTKAAVWLYLANILFVSVGLLSLAYESKAVGIFVIAFVAGTYVVVRHVARVEMYDSGSAMLAGLRRPANPILASIAYPAIDFLLLGFSLSLAIYLPNPEWSIDKIKNFTIDAFPVWCGIPFLCLLGVRTYHRVWSRARVSDFVYLVFALITGVILSWGTAHVVDSFAAEHLVFHPFVYYGCAVILIISFRALPRALQDVMSLSGMGTRKDARRGRNILIYGSGARAMLYLREKSFFVPRKNRGSRVVGLLDDDRNLRGRLVYGYRILGEIQDVEKVIADYSVTNIVIAAPISSMKRDRILEVAAAHGVSVSEWRTEEKIVEDGISTNAPVKSALKRAGNEG